MHVISFTVWGPILRGDIPGLTARVCRLLEEGKPDVALCEVCNVLVPDAVTVEALARLQLAEALVAAGRAGAFGLGQLVMPGLAS